MVPGVKAALGEILLNTAAGSNAFDAKTGKQSSGPLTLGHDPRHGREETQVRSDHERGSSDEVGEEDVFTDVYARCLEPRSRPCSSGTRNARPAIDAYDAIMQSTDTANDSHLGHDN